ncbi:MAG: DUF433 domain-containing protein, partial [Nitrospira sp. CG24E]
MTTNRIAMSPKVMMGKPVIRGTRIPVELILRKLGEGAIETDLLDAYPRLTKADIQAAIGRLLLPGALFTAGSFLLIWSDHNAW